jgi:hypothetical protein
LVKIGMAGKTERSDTEVVAFKPFTLPISQLIGVCGNHRTILPTAVLAR